jgi:hypothetical protein
MLNRQFVDFTRNPQEFINNMNIVNELISYYITDNTKILLDKKKHAPPGSDNSDNEIKKLNNIQSNLKPHNLNNTSINVFTNNSYNQLLVKTLVELIEMNNKLNKNVTKKSSDTSDASDKLDTSDTSMKIKPTKIETIDTLIDDLLIILTTKPINNMVGGSINKHNVNKYVKKFYKILLYINV